MRIHRARHLSERLHAHRIEQENSRAIDSMSAASQPRLDFMIIGVQKGGTNALYQFLRQHPEIGMSALVSPANLHHLGCAPWPRS